MSPDSIELAVAAILLALFLAWPRMAPRAADFAKKTAWCMLALAILPIALRLILLARDPAPIPATADDMSYLLLADTLRHLRLANPPHPFARFFETNFVLQAPTYSSIFPLGQGIALALGRILFGAGWAGVLLSEGIFCSLCYWMLRAWISPGWALAGGVLAAMEFGPLSYWMNSYWGGAVSGIAGCMVFGALPRRNGWLLGLGLGLQLLTRPFEFALLLIGLGGWALAVLGGRALARAGLQPRILLRAAIAFAPALALTLAHNHAVTGRWTTLPYQVSRDQYGVPATFTFQPNPSPHRDLSQEERDDYEAQSIIHDREARLPFATRLARRLPYARFFFLPPLYLALPFFFLQRRLAPILIPIAVFAIGTTFYPYFYPHYLAAIACLLLLAIVGGLEMLSQWSMPAALAVYLVATAHFAFWYGVNLFASDDTLASILPYETSDYLNHGDPEGRLPVLKRLANSKGKQLVFVSFSRSHPLREWIGNEADIDASRVVWALDLGRDENEKLRQYYPDRATWLLEPDDHPPRLQPYAQTLGIHFEPVPAQ
jgi:hypothetical protein